MNEITRRKALGTAIGAMATLGLAGAVASQAHAADSHAVQASGAADEVYLGRRIQITPASGDSHHGGGHHGGGHEGLPTVRIDGAELHVMRNADGTWISVVNHYETFSDPLSLARAAVRALQGAALVPMSMGGTA
ncbi:apotyrosinase chaperone MelC1 [Streptomyces vinaceus]